MFWKLLLVAVTGSHFAGGGSLTNGNSTQNASDGWMANLRRQLMQDNYDYEPSSDEPGLLPGLLDEGPGPAGGGAAGRDRDTETDQPTTLDGLYVPTFRNDPDDVEPSSEMKENTGRRLSRLSALADESRGARRRGAARQDLLYYVDDAWLHKDDGERRVDRDHNDLSSGDGDFSDGRRAFDAAPTTTNTYRLLQLPGSARRDGLGPRFVQERSARGVALLSLDGAPFPSFRLPRERRQYQETELD